MRGSPQGVELVLQACGAFGASDDIQEGIFSAMRAMRKICRAREILFDLRDVSPEIDGFFREAPRYHQQGKSYSRREGDRIIHFGSKADPYARGNASLFVRTDGEIKPSPLVIALHGGFGHGRISSGHGSGKPGPGITAHVAHVFGQNLGDRITRGRLNASSAGWTRSRRTIP